MVKDEPSAATAAVRKPRHRQVFETLLGDITSGRFQPGDRLPTEADLAKSFSASRSTVARAMRDLKRKGLLHRQRGGGTHIARHEGKRIALFAPFTESAALLGFTGGRIHAHLSDLAARAADHLRLQLVSRTDGDRLEHMLASAQAIINQGIEGVFYYPVELPPEQMEYNKLAVEKLVAAGIAVVIIDRDIVAFPDRSPYPLVAFDNQRGGYLATRHLLERGCKRIAFVDCTLVSSAASDRQRGYRNALADSGIATDPNLIWRGELVDLSPEFCKTLLEKGKPDAILCKQDHYAAVLGRHIVNTGMAIGQDILLAGFDDEPFAELLPVPLTTIRFPAHAFAQVCYERLAAQMANPSSPLPGMTLVDVELMIRSSTAGPAR